MKNKIIKLTTIMAMVLLSFGLYAQTPPHPNGGGAPGSGNTPVGGGAPIGGGLGILFVMGAAYASASLRGIKRNASVTEYRESKMP